ncbi:MAG: extracellular solute-binding protein, partial [Akkermansiaceae bacterium]|nr:extracellular solute-binding protein [Armatimonadota bacterium]
IGLYYNTKLFEEAGIVDAQGKAKPPTTEEEFLSAAKALTRDTNKDGLSDQWGFVLTWQRTNFLTLIGQFGGSLLSDDLSRAAMSSPAGIAAISWMHDLIFTHKVAPRPEGIDAWLTFRQGKAAMAFEGIYMLSSLEGQKELAYAGAPVPLLGEKRSAWGGSHLLAQPAAASDETAEASWRLMRYLSDHSIEWAKGGQVPARNDVRRSPEFAALPVQAAFGSQIEDVQYEPLSPRTNALFQFVDPAIEAVLLNLQPAEAAMQDADRRINQVLQRP